MVRRQQVPSTKRARTRRPRIKPAAENGVDDATTRLNDHWEELVNEGYEIDVGTTVTDLGLVDGRWKSERIKRALPLPAGAYEPSLKYEFLDNPSERWVLATEDGRLICRKVIEHRRSVTDR